MSSNQKVMVIPKRAYALYTYISNNLKEKSICEYILTMTIDEISQIQIQFADGYIYMVWIDT